VRLIIHNRFVALDSESTAAAFECARGIDPLHYLRGLKKLTYAPDRDKWNAKYDHIHDEIVLERKFEAKDFLDKVRTILHEAGHRGQYNDPATYSAFKAAGLNRKDYFLAMANPVHRQDYASNGIDNVAEEAFAESYARFALELKLPPAIAGFWSKRVYG
jgi:hypothetical protein